MTRDSAVALCRKLKALADHEATPAAEAETARTTMRRVMKEHEITEEELQEAPAGQVELPAWAQNIEMDKIYDAKTGRLNIEELDKIIDYVPDPRTRTILLGVTKVAGLVQIIFGGKK